MCVFKMCWRKKCHSCNANFMRNRKMVAEKRVTEGYMQKCPTIPEGVKTLEKGFFLCPSCYKLYLRARWTSLRIIQQKDEVKRLFQLPVTATNDNVSEQSEGESESFVVEQGLANASEPTGDTEDRDENQEGGSVVSVKGYRMGPVYAPALLPALLHDFLPQVVIPAPPLEDEPAQDDESYDPGVLWPIERILGRFYHDQTFKYVVEWKGVWRKGKITVEPISNLVGVSYDDMFNLQKQFDDRDEMVGCLPIIFPGRKRKKGRLPSRRTWELLQVQSNSN